MEEIYKNYSQKIYKYLYGLTNDTELAQELMQETFYSAIKSINKFEGNCKISVWLYEIAKNKWKNYLRENSKRRAVFFNDSKKVEKVAFEDELLEQLNSKNEVLDLYKAIHNLDEDVRELFYLRIKGDLSFKEIAEITGKSEEWARVTFYRGKLKLKEELLKNEKGM